MNLAYLRKTIQDAIWLLAASALALFAFSWIRVLIVASFEAERFQRIVDNLPDFVRRLAPVPVEELVSYPGLVGFTYEEPLVYLIMTVWAIARASDSVSGELSRGTLEMLLAQPLHRLEILWTHTVVTIAGAALLALATWTGTYLGVTLTRVRVPTPGPGWTLPLWGMEIPIPSFTSELKEVPMSDLAPAGLFWPATVNFLCMGIFLIGVTTALSAMDRYRWRTIGLMVGFYVLQSVAEIAGLSIDSCHWLLGTTFQAAYEPVAFTTRAVRAPETAWSLLVSDPQIGTKLGPLGMDSILLGLGLAGLLIASVVFVRRDLPAPL